MEDPEIKIMIELYAHLEKLDEAARARVVGWLIDKLDIQNLSKKVSASTPSLIEKEFSTFADLYNAAQPANNADKALLAGYWLQVNQQQPEFQSQSANRELQNLGHIVSNITDAFTQLKSKKPALAIQVKKSGKSQQSRKQYKLTQAGIDAVNTMITSQ